MKSSLCQPILLFLVISVFALRALAQPAVPDTIWMQYYGQGQALSGVSAADGDLFVLAMFPCHVFRIAPDGASRWSRSYTLSNPTSVIATADNGFFVVGYSPDTVQVIRANSNGDTLWTRKVRVDSLDAVAGAAACSDGGIFLAGSTAVNPRMVVLTKMNSAANVVWTRTFARPEGAWGWGSSSVVGTHDGGCIVTGTTNQVHVWQAFMMITDSGGNALSHRYYGTYNEMPAMGCTAIQTADSGYAFGYVWANLGYFNMTADKYGASMVELWQNTYAATYGSVVNAIAELPSGGLALAGSVSPYTYGMTKFAVIGTDTAGAEVWRITFPDSSMMSEANAVVAMPNGDLTVIGTRQVTPQQPSQVFAIRIGQAGNAATARASIIPADVGLTAFPNPFNPSTEIVFSLPHTQQISLRVFDVLGQSVATLAAGNLTAGEHRITFDGSGLPSGGYFYQLKSDGISQTRKMLLLK